MNKKYKKWILRMWRADDACLERWESQLVSSLYKAYRSELDKRDDEAFKSKDYSEALINSYVTFEEWLDEVEAYELEGAGFSEHEIMGMYT